MATKTQAELQQEQQNSQTTPAAGQQGVGTSQVTSSGTSGSGSYKTSYSVTTPAELPEVPPSQLQERLDAAGQVNTPEVPNAPDLKPQLDQWLSAAQQQSDARIDYATEQGVKELQRAQEDAQPQFQQMRNQISADEQRALDNQALYAETRGDRGGIGQAQYGSIQNTAAQNRLQVNQQQTKLATDTARQIADLRSQGEFQKADNLLSLTQSYLSQLIQIEQWAASYNMDAAQFRWNIEQWKANYNMQVAQILEDNRQWEASYGLQRANFLQGQYEWSQEFQQGQDQWEYQKQQDQNKTLAGAGEALLSAGVMPSDSQLAAMGMTKDQARSYIAALELSATASGSSGGGGGSSGGSSGRRSSGSGGGSGSGSGGSGGDDGSGTPKTGVSTAVKVAAQRAANPNNLSSQESSKVQDFINRATGKSGGSVQYDKSKGTITYGGKTYTSATNFLLALNSSGLTNAQKNAILEQLYQAGALARPKSGGSGSGSGSGGGGKKVVGMNR